MIIRRDELKRILDEAVDAAKNREGAKNALGFLFPDAEDILSTVPTPRKESDARRKHQVHIKEFAPLYFRLDPNLAAWPRTLIDATLKNESPSDAIIKVIDIIEGQSSDEDKSKLRRQFLDILCDHFKERQEIDQYWLLAILNSSVYFAKEKDETRGVFFRLHSNYSRLEQAIVFGLKDAPENTRGALIQETLDNVSDISLLCSIFRRFAGDTHPEGVTNKPDGFGKYTQELRNRLVGKIHEIVERGSFWLQVNVEEMIWFWWGCNLEYEVRRFTNSEMKNPHNLQQLLKLPISTIYSTGGDYDAINVESWQRIIDLTALEERAKELASSSNENLRKLAEAFLEALKRGNETPFGRKDTH